MKYFCLTLILFFTCLYFLSNDLYAQSDLFIKSTHTFNGRTIPYQIFIPDTLSPGTEYPLVLALHGSGSRGDDNNHVLYNSYLSFWAEDEIQQNHPCFVLVPQCPEDRWWENVIFIIDDMIDSLVTSYPIDSTRIYVSGHSMGSYGAWSTAFTYPIRFAAVIACAGTSDWIMSAMRYSSFVPPVWSFHGSIDNIEPVSKARAIVDSMNANGYHVIKTQNFSEAQLDSILATHPSYLYTEYPGVGHTDILLLVYQNNPRLINWLFNQQAPTLPLQDPVYPLGTQTNLSIPPIDFTYSSSQPVFSFGAPGTWDKAGVRAPAIIQDGDTVRMWYLGYDGNSPLRQIGYAWSLDGTIWYRYANNPVISPTYSWENGVVAPCCVIKENNTFKLWYVANPKAGLLAAIGYATSTDGINWTKHPNPVFLPGTSTDWDYVNVGRLTVINDGDQYLMWYATGNGMTHYQIGLATSVDGINWVKYNDPQTNEIPYINSDPVISFRSCSGDWQDVENPSVIKNGSGYHMLYCGSDSYESLVYYAFSDDGIHWTKFIEYPVFEQRPSWTNSHFFLSGCFLETNDNRFHYWYICFNFTPEYNFLIQPQLGYSVTVNDLPKVSAFDLDRNFLKVTKDSLHIKTRIENQIGHSLNVQAKFFKDNPLVSEIVPMFDDGLHNDSLAQDDIYGNYWICSEEATFNSIIEIEDLSNGFTYNSIVPFNLMKQVTSIGPVRQTKWRCNKDSLYAGLKAKFYFTLLNTGTVTTARNITSQVVALDTFVVIDPPAIPEYGDIAPGDSVEGDAGQYIRFSSDCYYGQQIYMKQNIYSDGYLFWSDTFVIDLNTGIRDVVVEYPLIYDLKQNYPNPFNPSTVISWQVGAIGRSPVQIELSIYNVLGQKVATLVSEKQKAGFHSVEWDASGFSSGVYYYQLVAGDPSASSGQVYRAVKKMILIK
jgi:predicted GH43/DUF377 family glycosyl hydrolase/predicted esterase